MTGPRLRPIAWVCLWLWVLGPVAGAVLTEHRHEGVDPCWLPGGVHDASQHRVEPGGLAPLAFDHCHACHVPRVHVAAVTTALHAAQHRVDPLGSRDAVVASHALVSLPPRSPPTLSL